MRFPSWVLGAALFCAFAQAHCVAGQEATGNHKPILVCSLYGAADQGMPAWQKDEACEVPSNLALDQNYHQPNLQFSGGGATSDLSNANVPAGIQLEITGNHFWAVTNPMSLDLNQGPNQTRIFRLHLYCGPAAPPGPGCNVRVNVYAMPANSSPAEPQNFTGWPAIFDARKSATVWIRLERPGKDPAYGSGVLINSSRQVLTARHVLPSHESVQSGNYRITGMVGWDTPSIDLTKAKKLTIEYESPHYDFAVLKFTDDWPGSTFVFADTGLRQAQNLLIMGYPDGNNLAPTPGYATRPEAHDTFSTDARIGIGSSGGPVFGPTGGLIGIVLAETDPAARDEGIINLSYFLRVDPIRKELAENHIALGVTPSAAQTSSQNDHKNLHIDYPVEIRQSAGMTNTALVRSFAAQNGFRIVSAKFHDVSQRGINGAVEVSVSADGRKVTLRMVESGSSVLVAGTLSMVQTR